MFISLRLLVEFLYFGIKNARACIFVGLFFGAMFSVPRAGLFGIPRYDVLLFVALAIQVWMIWSKLETLYIGDYRCYFAACALGLYARAAVIFRPLDTDRRMPLLLSFVLIGFFIWLAENTGTFFGVWKYPNQLGAWSMVHVGKWSSWSLLVVMTFTIIANLKHFKARIHVPSA